MDHSVSPMDKLHGFYFEELEVGQTDEFSKLVTESDILVFAGVSGDTNPVHLNHEFASETMFEERIAHGLLTASFISTVIGTKMPGPGCIYVSQNLKFKAPVKAGDLVTAQAMIIDMIPEKNFVVLSTKCLVGDKVVLDGEATIMVPSRKA